jgi:hypothetical protein
MHGVVDVDIGWLAVEQPANNMRPAATPIDAEANILGGIGVLMVCPLN